MALKQLMHLLIMGSSIRSNWNQDLKRNIFFKDLLIRTSKVTLTCVVNFLITCLVSEMLEEKERQRHYSSAILKVQKPHDVSTWVPLRNMLNVEIKLSLYVIQYTSYANCKVLKKISLRINSFTARFIQFAQIVTSVR